VSELRNLARINNYHQRLAAQRDWVWLRGWCQGQGVGEVAERLAPANDASWRMIDKQINRLRVELAGQGVTLPPCPSSQ